MNVCSEGLLQVCLIDVKDVQQFSILTELLFLITLKIKICSIPKMWQGERKGNSGMQLLVFMDSVV